MSHHAPEVEPKPEGPSDNITQVATLSTQSNFPTRAVELPGIEQLNEVNAYEHTAYAFSRARKWWILTVVALCQTSMNFVRGSCLLFSLYYFFLEVLMRR